MGNNKKNFKDLIAGLVVMIIAAFFYWTTLGTTSFMKMGRGRLAPDAVPKAIAGLMFALGIIIIIKWFIAFKRGTLPPIEIEDDSADCEGMTENEIKLRHLFQKITMPLTILTVCIYIYIMPEIGFVISTVLFLTFQITLLSTDLSLGSWVKNLIIAVVAALAIYIIFGCAFGLAVPKVSSVDLYLNDLYRLMAGAN